MGEGFTLTEFCNLLIAHLDAPEAIVRHSHYPICRTFLQTKKSNSRETEIFFLDSADEMKETDPANSNKSWHSLLRVTSNQIVPLAQQKKMSLNMMKLILKLFFELLKITDSKKERRYPPNEANPIVSETLLEACHLAYFMLVQATLSDHTSKIHLKSLDGLPWGKHHFHPTAVCLFIDCTLELCLV